MTRFEGWLVALLFGLSIVTNGILVYQMRRLHAQFDAHKAEILKAVREEMERTRKGLFG